MILVNKKETFKYECLHVGTCYKVSVKCYSLYFKNKTNKKNSSASTVCVWILINAVNEGFKYVYCIKRIRKIMHIYVKIYFVYVYTKKIIYRMSKNLLVNTFFFFFFMLIMAYEHVITGQPEQQGRAGI